MSLRARPRLCEILSHDRCELSKACSHISAQMHPQSSPAPVQQDLKITAVGGAPARQTLFKDGKIDAGMQPMPLNYELEALGFKNLGWAGKYEPDWQFTTVNTDGEWARRNPKVVTGFVRALLRQQFIFANPNEAAKIAATLAAVDSNKKLPKPTMKNKKG